MRGLVLVVATVLVGGCLSSPQRVLEAAAQEPAPLVLWSNPGFNATETTIAYGPRGTLFYGAAAVSGDGGKAPIFRSRDNGSTWTEVTPRYLNGEPAPYMATDPFIHVDAATGRLFGLTMQPSRTCGQLSWSDDEGETWSHNPHACGNAPIYDHQSIASGRPRLVPTVGFPNVVYQCYNRVYDTTCARSLDGGYTWLPLTSPFAGADPSARRGISEDLSYFCGGLSGQLHVARDGTVFLPREHCGRAKLAISRDDGTTWTTVTVSSEVISNGPDPVVTTDSSGTVFYMWMDEAGSLRLSHSKDNGATWSKPLAFLPDNMTTHLPAVAAHGPGQVALGFIATDDIPGGFQHPEYRLQAEDRKPDGVINSAVWYPYIAVFEAATDPSGHVSILRAVEADDPVNRGDCDPRYCAGFYRDYHGIAVSPTGRIAAAYADHCVDRCLLPDATVKDNVGYTTTTAAGLATLQWWG